MVRPASFGYNQETATDNHFQEQQAKDLQLNERAQSEFDQAVEILRSKTIDVVVLNDEPFPPKPDAIFPNNWFTCRQGIIDLFPMYAANRRIERDPKLIADLRHNTGASTLNDLSGSESEGNFLEGTGSMVFDHVNKTVYACISERTNIELLKMYCKENDHTLLSFEAVDEDGRPIYHTNVMLSIGKNFSVLCDEAIRDRSERNRVKEELLRTAHEIIDISQDQLKKFCGNILELKGSKGQPLIVMSETAFNGFDLSQKEKIEQFGEIVQCKIPTIEKTGGGSIRCMIAEIF